MSLLMILIVISFSFIFGTATFIHLFILMKRRHFFEFQRSKNIMIVIFFIMSGQFVTFTYVIVNDISVGLEIDFSIWITKQKELEFQKLEIYTCWILQFPFLLSCLAIIELKGTRDCLQGIAKLDYLFKVSIFQKYRDKELEAHKQRIFSSITRSTITPTPGEPSDDLRASN